jgi:hypothetical protein
MIKLFEDEEVEFDDFIYPEFQDAKPHFNLTLNYSLGQINKPGLFFIYKDKKLIEFSQF